MGMTVKEFQPVGGGETRKSLSFGNQKINLHHVKSPYKPHAKNPLSGTIDICFLSSTPLEKWESIFLKNGIENMLKEMMPGQVETVNAING